MGCEGSVLLREQQVKAAKKSAGLTRARRESRCQTNEGKRLQRGRNRASVGRHRIWRKVAMIRLRRKSGVEPPHSKKARRRSGDRRSQASRGRRCPEFSFCGRGESVRGRWHWRFASCSSGFPGACGG